MKSTASKSVYKFGAIVCLTSNYIPPNLGVDTKVSYTPSAPVPETVHVNHDRFQYRFTELIKDTPLNLVVYNLLATLVEHTHPTPVLQSRTCDPVMQYPRLTLCSPNYDTIKI